MDEKLAIVKDCAMRILERAAFLFSDEIAENCIPGTDASWIGKGVGLEYQGPVVGEIRLWVGSGLPKMIAANMLGMEDESTIGDKEQSDAVKEILNILAGIFITEAFGTEPVFQLSIPAELDMDDYLQSLKSPEHTWLMVEGEPVLISLHGGQ